MLLERDLMYMYTVYSALAFVSTCIFLDNPDFDKCC